MKNDNIPPPLYLSFNWTDYPIFEFTYQTSMGIWLFFEDYYKHKMSYDEVIWLMHGGRDKWVLKQDCNLDYFPFSRNRFIKPFFDWWLCRRHYESLEKLYPIPTNEKGEIGTLYLEEEK